MPLLWCCDPLCSCFSTDLLGAYCKCGKLWRIASVAFHGGLRAASYCKAKLAEEGFVLEDESWAPVHTIDLNAELAQLLVENGVSPRLRFVDKYGGQNTVVGTLPTSLLFVAKDGREDPDMALWNGVGVGGSLASYNNNTFLVLGLSLPNPLKPSSLRGVYELPQAEVTFYTGDNVGFYSRPWDPESPSQWRASAGYLMPSRPKKQRRCADQSSGTDDYLSELHLVCLELCRPDNFTGVDDCHDQVGVSLSLPAVRNAHFLSAEGSIESLRLEGDPLRFQPTALTTLGWRGNYSYSLLPEVASWCKAVDSSGVLGEFASSGSSYASPCQQGIAATLIDRYESLSLLGKWARRYRRPVWKVPMQATLHPTCLQGKGSYLECGPFAGTSIVSTVVLEMHNFECSAGRFSARFAIIAAKPQPSSSWLQGNVSGFDSLEAESEDIIFDFVAEGLVDASGTSLCMVACRKRPRQDPNSAEICEDCKMGIKLQGPAAGGNLTILDRNTVAVTLSSLRMETDPFFFKALTFRGHLDIEENTGNLAEVACKYMYTKDDVATLVCDDSVADAPSHHSIYPVEPSASPPSWTTFGAETFYLDHRPKNYDLQPEGPSNFSGGYIYLDSYHFNRGCVVHDGSRRSLQGQPGLDCVAYRVQLRWPNAFDHSSMDHWYMEAEGTYDSVQRRLCLIACRSVLPLLVGEKLCCPPPLRSTLCAMPAPVEPLRTESRFYSENRIGAWGSSGVGGKPESYRKASVVAKLLRAQTWLCPARRRRRHRDKLSRSDEWTAQRILVAAIATTCDFVLSLSLALFFLVAKEIVSFRAAWLPGSNIAPQPSPGLVPLDSSLCLRSATLVSTYKFLVFVAKEIRIKLYMVGCFLVLHCLQPGWVLP